MHVLIIGGGIGGLALAHGLRRRGVSVAVFERDRRPSDRWEGYRIHIDPTGSRALEACLPPEQWEAFRATAGREGNLTFVTETLSELVTVDGETLWPSQRDDGAEEHHAADRAVLRRILLSGLEDVVHLGHEFERFEQTPDGKITAVFTNGSRIAGDLLVAADGAGSRVRRQYLPDAGRHLTGAVGIGHKIFLGDGAADGGTVSAVPEELTRGMTMVTTPDPAFLFTAVFNPPADLPDRLAALGVTDPPSTQPYVLAALVADRKAFPVDPAELDEPALARAVDHFVSNWDPRLRRLLASADPATRNADVFRASVRPEPWTPSRITLLGDAIHQMPPVGGMGGNTALRDAALLTEHLAHAAARGDVDLVGAIGDYEARMRDYGFAAVDRALAQQAESLATGPLRTAATRTFLWLCGRVRPLRRRMFDQTRRAAA